MGVEHGLESFEMLAVDITQIDKVNGEYVFA